MKIAAIVQSRMNSTRLPGKVMAKDVVKLNKATTVEGSDVAIVVSGGTVTVDNAKVIKTDINSSNGVIHVIDTVILPKKRSSSDVSHSDKTLGGCQGSEALVVLINIENRYF